MNQRAASAAITALFILGICFFSNHCPRLRRADGPAPYRQGRSRTLVFSLFLTCGVVELFAGPLVDRWGHKPVATLGFLVTNSGLLLPAFAPSFTAAVVAAMLLGVGDGCLNTAESTRIPVVLIRGQEPG